MSKHHTFFAGRRILITGGTGSIGKQIVRTALEDGAALVRILSRSHKEQAKLAEELAEYSSKLFITTGSITSKEDIERAMEDVSYVFHAAADKYVPHCELEPWAAVRTNIFGTHNVITAASRINTRVER